MCIRDRTIACAGRTEPPTHAHREDEAREARRYKNEALEWEACEMVEKAMEEGGRPGTLIGSRR
eukprot:5675506-Alexandrium_andersonii.AAC.1